MNWNQMQANWKQAKGSVKQEFGSLTDNDLEMIAGSRDKLIGKLQERYGITREEAQRRADQWLQHAGQSTKEDAHQHAGQR